MHAAKLRVGCSGSRRRLPQRSLVALGSKHAPVFLVLGQSGIVSERSTAAHRQELVVHGGRSHEHGGPKPEA